MIVAAQAALIPNVLYDFLKNLKGAFLRLLFLVYIQFQHKWQRLLILIFC